MNGNGESLQRELVNLGGPEKKEVEASLFCSDAYYTLQEVVTLRSRVEALEAETARMLAFSVEKEKKESAQKNAPSPMLWISEERQLLPNPAETSVRSQNLPYRLSKTLTGLLYYLVQENSHCRDPLNLLLMHP